MHDTRNDAAAAVRAEDVASLLRFHSEEIDRAYVQRWIAALEVGSQWDAVLQSVLGDR